jgi:anti-sigma factor RsiW
VNCRQVIDFLMDYIDGELPEHVKACFDMHLQMCPPCVEYLRTYRATVTVTKACLHDHAATCTEPMPEQLIQAILAAKQHCGRAS